MPLEQQVRLEIAVGEQVAERVGNLLVARKLARGKNPSVDHGASVGRRSTVDLRYRYLDEPSRWFSDAVTNGDMQPAEAAR